uniref:Short/branched chain specific acyl-CoA dehydrogenase, mitochondrial n=1 Tax=Rhabditophanes sp. KR3021 TaxID=114890 RepID=A0AC35UGK8_9BILA
MNNLLKNFRPATISCARNTWKSQVLPPRATEVCSPITQLSEEELAFQDTVRKFSLNTIKPLVREMDENNKMDKSVLNGLFENGFFGISIPAEYDGLELEFFKEALMVEELSKVDPSVAITISVHNTLVLPLIIKYGSEEQKRKYLTRCHKDWIGSFCLTEPSSGSDAFALKTTAKADGGDYIINGSKMWITNAQYAEFFVVMANCDPSKGYRGITCFIVDKDQAGVSVGKNEDKLGIRASSTCAVHFDNVRVPKSSILGELGKGYKYSIDCLNSGRVVIAAQMNGLASGCLDATIPYLQERKQFNTRLIDFQGIQFDVATIASEIEISRTMTINACRLYEQGHSIIKEASMAKLFASKMATNATSKCVEMMGGVGFSKEFPVEKLYRDCKIGTIYEGSSNIQMSTIAKIIDADYTH